MDHQFFQRSCQYKKLNLGKCFSHGIFVVCLFTSDTVRVRQSERAWNHKIRKSNRTNVYGIPDELYLFPESRGYVQYGKKTDPEVNDILHYLDLHTQAGNINKRFDQNILDYIKYVLQEHHMSYPPRDWNEAKEMYGIIIELAAQ